MKISIENNEALTLFELPVHFIAEEGKEKRYWRNRILYKLSDETKGSLLV